MKLFVDDIRPAPKGWYLAKTVTEAIRLIDLYDWKEISLDHDIFIACAYGEDRIIKMAGIEPFNAHKASEDFTAVARFITHAAKSRENGLQTIRIHTANPNGYDRLKAILEPLRASGVVIIRDTTYLSEWGWI